MVNVNCLNNIASVGLDLFSDDYNTESSFEDAQAVLVRSAKMHDMELGDNLLAIARAGAGVNNIPLDKCAESGIVVFNTPGANANAVKEQVLAAMLLASRDLIGGNEWVKANKDDADIAKATEKAKKAFAGQEIKGKKLGVIGLGAMWFMGRNKSDSDSAASSQTEEQQEDAAADLVIKGDGDTADDAEPAEETDAEETEETEEAAPEEEEAEPEEPQTVTMKVNASSLNVRSEANTTSSVVTSLTNGDTVEVLGDASQEWVQIRCTSKNNEEGYVKSEYLVAAE